MADITDYIGIAAAGGGVIYGGYEWWASDKTRSNWNTCVSEGKSMQALLADYFQEVQELMAKFDTAYANSTQVDSADVDSEEASIANKEKELQQMITTIINSTNSINNPGGIWSMIEGGAKDLFGSSAGIWFPALKVIGAGLGIGGLGIWIIGTLWVPPTLGILRLIKKVQDNNNDKNKPTGTSGSCPKCGQVIEGSTSEEFRMNMQRHLQVDHTIEIQATVLAMPSAEAEFSALPDWVQKQLATTVGIWPWYNQSYQGSVGNQWQYQVSLNPTVVCAIAAAAIALGIVCTPLGPTILSGLGGFIDTMVANMPLVAG